MRNACVSWDEPRIADAFADGDDADDEDPLLPPARDSALKGEP